MVGFSVLLKNKRLHISSVWPPSDKNLIPAANLGPRDVRIHFDNKLRVLLTESSTAGKCGGAGGPVCLFMSQLEKLSCHQLIRQTSDIMEKATKIAEIEGMLDCRGSALCSAL